MLRQAVVILAVLAASPGQVAAQFFPPGAFSERADRHQFVSAWYSKHLSAMDEPSLLKMAEAGAHEVYRFTWLRTFHAPFAFRLDVRPDGSGSLLVKSTNGKGVKGGKYHVVDRWTPESGQFRRVMLDLVALAGVAVTPVY